MNALSLPTQEQCLAYFEEYKVPKNILAHCQAVQHVSMFVAQVLNKRGQSLDLEFIRSLSILHDLFKAVTLKELRQHPFYHPEPFSAVEIEAHKKLRERFVGLHEGDIAFEVFKDAYPSLAEALKRCSNLQIAIKTPEEELVHYCDWRVLRTDIVSLQERFDYIAKTYAKQGEAWEEDKQRMRKYEQKICAILSFTPQDLKQQFEKQKAVEARL